MTTENVLKPIRTTRALAFKAAKKYGVAIVATSVALVVLNKVVDKKDENETETNVIED